MRLPYLGRPYEWRRLANEGLPQVPGSHVTRNGSSDRITWQGSRRKGAATRGTIPRPTWAPRAPHTPMHTITPRRRLRAGGGHSLRACAVPRVAKNAHAASAPCPLLTNTRARGPSMCDLCDKVFSRRASATSRDSHRPSSTGNPRSSAATRSRRARQHGHAHAVTEVCVPPPPADGRNNRPPAGARARPPPHWSSGLAHTKQHATEGLARETHQCVPGGPHTSPHGLQKRATQ